MENLKRVKAVMKLIEGRQEREVIKQNMERDQQAENGELEAKDNKSETSKEG